MDDIIMIIYTLSLCLLEYIYYLCGKDKKTCIFHFLKKMAPINTLYVKVLQTISNRNNFITESQKLALFKYTDNVPYTLNDIDTEFENQLNHENIILENNGLPIRAGCVALVYKGLLDDKVVIIKVARKNIKKKIECSLNQLHYMIKFLTFFSKNLTINVNEILHEHRSIFINQLDFTLEVQNLEKTYHNFKNIDNVIIPKVYPIFTNKYNNMIVMEYIEGGTIHDIQENDKDTYIEIIIKYLLKSLLYDRFYHADFHPGNIIFCKNNACKNNICKIGVIDYGIMNSLTSDEQTCIHHFMECMYNSDDYCEGIRKFLDNIIIPKQKYNMLNLSTKNNLLVNISEIVKRGFSRSFLNMEDLTNMNNIIKDYELMIDPSICKLIMAFTILDSVVHNIKKNVNYIHLIRKYAKSMFLTDLIDLLEM